MTPLWVAGWAGVVAHAIDAESTVVDGWAKSACRPRGRVRLDVSSVENLPQCNNCKNALARECGTYAGYQYHSKRGERPCRPCRDAANAYQRERRQANPDVRAKDNRDNAARNRAVWRLAAEHPERYRELVAEELAR